MIEKMIELEHIMEILVTNIAGLLEFIGVIIVAIGAGKAVFKLIKTKYDLYNSKIRKKKGGSK